MVVIGQSSCIPEKVVVSRKKRASVVVIGHNWLYSGKKGFIRAKWLFPDKSGCIRAKLLY